MKMDLLTPVLDVRVRWNSTHKMIHRANELRPARDRLLMLDPTTIFHQAHFQLTETDWSTLIRLEQILDVFVEATTFASSSTYPTLTQQLLYYQYIQNKLHELVQREHDTKDSSGDATSHFLWVAADEAYQKLNQYWQKMDDHTGQIVATILDPRMKLTVFENLGWDQEWVEAAWDKFMRVYNRYYAKFEEQHLVNNPVVRVGTGFPQGPWQPRRHHGDRFSDFNNLVFGPPEEPTQLPGAEMIGRNFLDAKRVDRDAEPVDLWRQHAHGFRSLAVMLRDYLSVPATRYDLAITYIPAIYFC